MGLRCEYCGYNKERIVSNLYKCKNCGYILSLEKNDDYISLVETDLRKFNLTYDVAWRQVTTFIYQLDLLKIMNMCKQLEANKEYFDKIKRLIDTIDKNENKFTDFDRVKKLPRVFLDKLLYGVK